MLGFRDLGLCNAQAQSTRRLAHKRDLVHPLVRRIRKISLENVYVIPHDTNRFSEGRCARFTSGD